MAMAAAAATIVSSSSFTARSLRTSVMPPSRALSSSSSSLLAASSLSGSWLCPAPAARNPGPLSLPPQRLQVVALKKIKGKVVCSSNDKTVSVEVMRVYKHPKYKKRIRSSKKYHAHDEENRCSVGDTVTLVKCAPVSKTKKFLVAEIVPKRKASAEPVAA